ncbi:mechanosensitive ion channel family protein [Candidatus Altiarchaeota archaeon]
MNLEGLIRDPGFMTIVKVAGTLVATIIIAKISRKAMNKYVKRKAGRLKIDETQFIVLRRLAVFMIYAGGVLYAGSFIPGFSTLGTSVLASAGVLALVIGFAAQHAFANIISGIFIAMFEPFKVGDKIQIGEEFGTVEDITLRHTIVKTWREKRIVIPNSKISEESISNFSLRNPRVLGILEIGISYDSDIDKARSIMLDEALKHPDIMHDVKGDDNAFLPKNEIVLVRLVDLTDFAQMMRLYYWAPDRSTDYKIKFDLTESIKKRFDAEGIEIPFPYRTIVYKKDID